MKLRISLGLIIYNECTNKILSKGLIVIDILMSLKGDNTVLDMRLKSSFLVLLQFFSV